VLDWNPNDPDTVKVHYDVTAWSLDQRVELSEALADADIAHVWEGDEIVVPEELEADTDALFARLEELLGPFAIALSNDDAGVEYGLDEWPSGDRQLLTQALIEAEVPHRWDGTTVLVATDAEASVDEMLDAIEQGTLVLASGEAAAGAPEGALDLLFSSSDRLARDPDEKVGREELLDLLPLISPTVPPYGLSMGAWSRAVDAAVTLGALVEDEDSSASDIIGAAQELRSLVREYVS
jgi:hypothetical protein